MQLLIDDYRDGIVAAGLGECPEMRVGTEARRQAARETLVELRRRLRRERAMGRCGHVGYSLSRHLVLAQMVRKAEAACRGLPGHAEAAAR